MGKFVFCSATTGRSTEPVQCCQRTSLPAARGVPGIYYTPVRWLGVRRTEPLCGRWGNVRPLNKRIATRRPAVLNTRPHPSRFNDWITPSMPPLREYVRRMERDNAALPARTNATPVPPIVSFHPPNGGSCVTGITNGTLGVNQPPSECVTHHHAAGGAPGPGLGEVVPVQWCNAGVGGSASAETRRPVNRCGCRRSL